VLATAVRWRVVTAAVAFCVAMWMAAAVVALGWHFPTDAGAGACFGVGGVLLVDGSVWRLSQMCRPRMSPVTPSGD